MTTDGAVAQDLTISDLAIRTGLTPATLRAWETRHGFPVPTRRASGHRRYDEHDVSLVREVLRRRDAGVRLEAAIAEVAASRAVLTTPTTSVFAELRRTQPHLAPQQLRKSTLLALTWAMEDELCARAQQPILFAAFQEARFFTQAEARWRELARGAYTAVVFADFGGDHRVGSAVEALHLPEEAPMRREWSLVCDASDYTAALAAWELPGQDDVPDRDRVFESLWTLEPRAVRDAARACVRLADVLAPDAEHDWRRLDSAAPEPSDDLRAATSFFGRLVAYLDRGHR
jgi:MerR family transcriptional regulator, light-induced transcriptional regulator